MASGYGMSGGTSRCYPYWQEYMACYVMTRDDQAVRAKGPCLPRLEDYYECLHHKKEYARVAAMQAAIRKEAKAGAREGSALNRDKIKSLGLLVDKLKDEESK